MLPVAALLPAIISRWKLIVSGLLLVAVASIIGLAYHHYASLVAENARLSADTASLRVALSVEKSAVDSARATVERWQRAERERAATERVLAEAAERARRESRDLDAAISADGGVRDLGGSIARFLCLFERASAGDSRDCPGAGATRVPPAP